MKLCTEERNTNNPKKRCLRGYTLGHTEDPDPGLDFRTLASFLVGDTHTAHSELAAYSLFSSHNPMLSSMPPFFYVEHSTGAFVLRDVFAHILLPTSAMTERAAQAKIRYKYKVRNGLGRGLGLSEHQVRRSTRSATRMSRGVPFLLYATVSHNHPENRLLSSDYSPTRRSFQNTAWRIVNRWTEHNQVRRGA